MQKNVSSPKEMADRAWRRVSITKKTSAGGISARGLNRHKFHSSHTTNTNENNESTAMQTVIHDEKRSIGSIKRSVLQENKKMPSSSQSNKTTPRNETTSQG